MEGVTVMTVGVQVAGRARWVAVEVGRTISTGMVGGGAGFRGESGFEKIRKNTAHNPIITTSNRMVNIFQRRLDLRRFSSTRMSSGNS
jgi:hypothetical protein